jgi:hypothetical protein
LLLVGGKAGALLFLTGVVLKTVLIIDLKKVLKKFKIL